MISLMFYWHWVRHADPFPQPAPVSIHTSLFLSEADTNSSGVQNGHATPAPDELRVDIEAPAASLPEEQPIGPEAPEGGAGGVFRPIMFSYHLSLFVQIIA
jgi:hypothetical protein